MRWARQSSGTLKAREVSVDVSIGTLAPQDRPVLSELTPLYDRLQLTSQHLADRMCPVRLANGLAQVWVLSEHALDDQAKALLLAITQAGLTLASPARLIVPAAVLGELNRSHRSGEKPTLLQQSAVTTPRHVLMALLDDLIAWALRHDASDIHLTVHHDRLQADVAFTINGACVRPGTFEQCSTQTVQELLAVTWMTIQGGNGAVLDLTREQQGRFERVIAGHRVGLRWASLVIQGGLSVCWRLLSRASWQRVPSLEALGYNEQQQLHLIRALNPDGGLVAFAGLVGSGKSTSLASLMQRIPSTRKVITLEDPVEYAIPNALQCAVSGFDAQALSGHLASKLKTIKRSAAHDVLIGELRDTQGGQAVVDLVMSGANVYTTVHASSAMHIMARLQSSLIGVPESLLVMPGFVKLLVYQVLLKRLCTACALTATEWLHDQQAPVNTAETRRREAWLESLGQATGGTWQAWRFQRAGGCGKCAKANQQGAGYAGRLLLAEMIEPARMPQFYAQLASGDLVRQIAQWQWSARAKQQALPGYIPVSQAAWHCVDVGLLDVNDCVARFGDPVEQRQSEEGVCLR